MECQICNVRSSDGFCVICQRLACEECSHICQKCGKRACVDHGYTHKSGRWVCSNCLEQRKSRKTKGASAAPDLAGAPVAASAPPGPGIEPEQELVFEEPPAVPRLEVEPWKAGLTVGVVVIVSASAFAITWGDIPWPILLVALLGVFWSAIGVFGRHKKKGLSITGLAINVVPFVLLLVPAIGITGLQRKPDVDDSISGLTEQQQIEERRREAEKFIEQIRRSRGSGAAPTAPGESVPPPDAMSQ